MRGLIPERAAIKTPVRCTKCNCDMKSEWSGVSKMLGFGLKIDADSKSIKRPSKIDSTHRSE